MQVEQQKRIWETPWKRKLDVEKGQVIAILNSDKQDVEKVISIVKDAYTIRSKKTNKPKMIYEVVK